MSYAMYVLPHILFVHRTQDRNVHSAGSGLANDQSYLRKFSDSILKYSCVLVESKTHRGDHCIRNLLLMHMIPPF